MPDTKFCVTSRRILHYIISGIGITYRIIPVYATNAR